MLCSAFPRGPCHGRSYSTNAVYTSIPKPFDSDDEIEIGTTSTTYTYYRSPAATLNRPATSPWPPLIPTIPTIPTILTVPKSSTSKSLTGFHVRDRYHDQVRNDAAGRRRSANADILESLGLPSMVSFQDMKTLEDGVSEGDILGHRKRGHRRQSSRRVSVCLSAYNDCVRGAAAAVGDGAAQVARRVSQPLSTMARWTRKVTPSSIHQRMHKKQNQDADHPAPVHSASDDHGIDDAVLDEKQAHASGMPHTEAPQWKANLAPLLRGEAQSILHCPRVRQRNVASITSVDKKAI